MQKRWYFAQAFKAGNVALTELEMVHFCKTTVAVHDECNVARNRSSPNDLNEPFKSKTLEVLHDGEVQEPLDERHDCKLVVN